jgi:hypothetical protein
MAEPPHEIYGARVIRYAGDPNCGWRERGKSSDVPSDVKAVAVVDYGGAVARDDDHYLLHFHGAGSVTDDDVMDRANAIVCFHEEISWLGLVEIPLLPSPWQDVNADSVVQDRLSTLLRQELGETHSYPWGVRCVSATCNWCEGALCEINRREWAVINTITWTGQLSQSTRPRVEAYGSWEDVRRAVDRHTARSH